MKHPATWSRLGVALSAALFAATQTLAFEKYMIRVPDDLKPEEGIKGATTYPFVTTAVTVPLKDGNRMYIVNETPKQESEGGPAQIGVPKNVVELDVVSRYLEAMKRFPSITVQIGESTFFAYRCRDMFPPQDGLFLNNCYQGLVVSMGSEYAISLFLPDGRGFDGEVRGILKRISFVPCPGTAVESALKLYGPSSAVPVASRFAVVKKMVERRGECAELIELLSTLTDDASTKKWCAAQLKRLNPGKYAPNKRKSISYYDFNDDAQQKAVMAMLGASKDAKKAVVSVPGKLVAAKPAAPAKPVAEKPAAPAAPSVPVAETPAEPVAPVAAKPVAAKPAEPEPPVEVKLGSGQADYKGRTWSYYVWGKDNSCGKPAGAEVEGVSDCSGVVEFPKRLGGAKIITLARQLCRNRKEMTGVVLPEGLETIETEAFVGCTGLEKVVLPKSLKKLENGAFFLCEKLTGDFDLSRLEKIEGWLFKGCPRIRSVILPEGLTFLDNYMFESCSNLVKVTIPKSVKFIDSGVFGDCVSFKGEMEIPEGVTNIGYGAFKNCSGLTSIKIPSSVRKFGDSVFQGCSGVSRFDVPKDLDKISEFMFAQTGLAAFDIPAGVKKIGAGAFSGCKSLKGVTLPQGLEKLENWAFKESGIESIDIPGGVKQIDPYAIAACASLKTVALHEGLKTIRKGAFRDCAALEEITIPASVETIEAEAFAGCASLKNVVFLGKRPLIIQGTFKGCPQSIVDEFEPHPPKLPEGYGSVKMKTKTVSSSEHFDPEVATTADTDKTVMNTGGTVNPPVNLPVNPPVNLAVNLPVT